MLILQSSRLLKSERAPGERLSGAGGDCDCSGWGDVGGGFGK